MSSANKPPMKRMFPYTCRHCGFTCLLKEIGMSVTCPACGRRGQPKELFRVYNNKFRIETPEELNPPPAEARRERAR